MSSRFGLAVLVVLLVVGRPVGAQCVEWSAGEFVSAHVNGDLDVLAVVDDGTGPALYAGGEFTAMGGVFAQRIARLSNGRWTPLGPGLTPQFRGRAIGAIAAFDDGSGRAIHVGGSFLLDGDPVPRSLVRFDGRRFVAVGGAGAPDRVDALAAFDDGSGRALFVGGIVGDRGALLRWDGASWTTIADFGVETVRSMAVFDDGSGPALFVATRSASSFRMSRWDGTALRDAGAGLPGPVNALAAFDDGSGPALYGGGVFRPGCLAKWDGAAWRTIAPGVRWEVLSLAAHDDGAGARLAVGGFGGVALFDGAAWSEPGDDPPQAVTVLASFAPTAGARASLFAATRLHLPPPPLGRSRGLLARWDGARWLPPAPGIDSPPSAIEAFDDGRGPAIFAAGAFEQMGDAPAGGVARFDGRAWSALGSGLEGGGASGLALAAFDDGRGPALYVGGSFAIADGVAARNVARWDGATFEPLGAGLDGDCFALAVFDDGSGPALYAAGAFLEAGGVAAARVARWDGAAWTPLGTGLNGTPSTLVAADDGGGTALFAAGSFSRAGGGRALRIAKWDGVAWSALGAGADGDVESLAEFDFGGGPRLVAGGSFFSVGGVVSPRVAFWDGTAWNRLDVAIPVGFSARVLRVEEPGRAALFFSSCGGGPADDGCVLARWTAGAFEELTPAPDGLVVDLVSFDDGFGSSLYACGHFTAFGAGPSAGFARRSVADAPARSGNVNAGRGAVADVLTVDGSRGDDACRRVVVKAAARHRLEIAKPPAGGRGDYVLWILDGAPDPRRDAPARLRAPGGSTIDLGRACRALPIENLFSPDTVPCPTAFPFAIASRRVGVAAAASAMCLAPGGAALRRAPAAFWLAFPRGTYTIAGIVLDPGSANGVPISVANAVIVEAR